MVRVTLHRTQLHLLMMYLQRVHVASTGGLLLSASRWRRSMGWRT